MAMTEREQRDFRSYCGSLLDKYGFHFTTTDPTTPIMFVIHKELQECLEANKALVGEVKNAASKINPEIFQFNTHGEARGFQVGRGLKWLIISIPVLVFFVIAAWWYRMANDVHQASFIIDNSANIHELVKRVKKIDDFYVIDFTAAQKDSITPYVEFRRVDTKTVRVYLGKGVNNPNQPK